MPEARYFELRSHIGVEPKRIRGKDGEPVDNPKAGELQPLQPSTLTLAIPTMVKGEVAITEQSVTIEPLEPGSRITSTSDPVLANALAGHAAFNEVDPPKKTTPKKQEG